MADNSVLEQPEGTYEEPIASAARVGKADPVGDWCQFEQRDTHPQPALGWQGPLAFARSHTAARGIDHDFGSRWGPNGDQRVSLRVEVGATTGLLYVYDPTWDEYAVLGTDLRQAAVQDAFARAPRLGEHVAVEDFVALLPHVPAVRACLGLEL